MSETPAGSPPAAGSSRRDFLARLGLAALAAPLASRLGGVAEAYADALPAKGPGEEGFRPRELLAAYSLEPGLTYLNHASIGTVPRAVQEARRGFDEVCERNPWLALWGGAWEEPREAVRASAAALLGCAAEEVALLHNTTEAFNLLAHGLPLGPGDEVLFSSLNHAGASACWHHVAEARGFSVRRFELPVADLPGLEASDVVELHRREIGEATRVLVLPHVDNTVGLRHPVAAIAAAARRLGVRFVAVDAAQTVGMLPVDAASMGADVVATSPHKWLQAPKGLGLAYVRREVQEVLRPMWVTWGQERWSGSARKYEDYGTRNLAEVLALGTALEFQGRLGEAAKEIHHRRLFEHGRRVVESRPDLAWRSPRSWEMGAALWAVEKRGDASGPLAQRLFRERGFVLRPFETHGLSSLRISPNVATSTDDLDRLFTALAGEG